MLGGWFRFLVKNVTDQTFTYNSGARIITSILPWKMTSGARANGSLITDDSAFLTTAGTLAANAVTVGTKRDNTTLLHIGFTGNFRCVADVSSTDGTMDLYMEMGSADATWISDEADFDITKHCILLAKLPFSTDAEDEGAQIPFSF